MLPPRRIWGLALLVLIPCVLSAQDLDADRRIINYEDGSVFVGRVVRATQHQVVMLANTGDSLHLDVSKITRWKKYRDDIELKQRGKYHYKKGVFASFDLGFSLNSEDGSGQFDFILGYRKDARMSFGLGTGIHVNVKTLAGFFVENDFAPVYAYGRRYLGKGNAGPFIFTKLGYGFAVRGPFLDEHSGGVLFQPGFGLHFASRGKYRFILSISEYIQHTRGSQETTDFVFNNPIDVDYSIWYTRLMLKLGIEFR